MGLWFGLGLVACSYEWFTVVSKLFVGLKQVNLRPSKGNVSWFKDVRICLLENVIEENILFFPMHATFNALSFKTFSSDIRL